MSIDNKKYTEVDSINQLRTENDVQWGICKVKDVNRWFLIDRSNASVDNGRTVVACKSGQGRWVVMNQTLT